MNGTHPQPPCIVLLCDARDAAALPLLEMLHSLLAQDVTDWQLHAWVARDIDNRARWHLTDMASRDERFCVRHDDSITPPPGDPSDWLVTCHADGYWPPGALREVVSMITDLPYVHRVSGRCGRRSALRLADEAPFRDNIVFTRRDACGSTSDPSQASVSTDALGYIPLTLMYRWLDDEPTRRA